ncbi:MAG: minor capsid protein [Longimicrobiales bacterium]
MSSSLVSDLQTYLAAQGIVDGDTDWVSTRHQPHDGQARLVTIAVDGGPAPEVGTSQGLGSAAARNPGVQVRCRGRAGKGDEAEAKAREILDHLHGRTGVTMDGTRYWGIEAVTSDPIEVGADDNNRPEFSISFRCQTAQAAPA